MIENIYENNSEYIWSYSHSYATEDGMKSYA